MAVTETAGGLMGFSHENFPHPFRFLIYVALLLLSPGWGSIEASAQDSATGGRAGVATLSSAGSMTGVNLQRNYAYQAKGLAQKPTQVAWRSPRLFNMPYLGMGTSFINNEYLVGQTQYSFPTYFNFSDPILSGKTLLISINIGNAYLTALSAEDGAIRWNLPFKRTWLSAPAVAGGVVYVISNENWLYGFDLETGRELWRHKEKGKQLSTSPPVIAQGVVFFMTLDNTLHALQLDSRDKAWLFKAKHGINSYAMINDTLILGGEKGMLYALNVKTGQVKWQFDADGDINTVTIDKDTAYFRTVKGMLYAVALENGAQRWVLKLGGSVLPVFPISSVQIGSTLAFSDDALFFTGEESKKFFLYAIDSRQGKQIWKFELDSPSRSPVIAGGLIYVGTIGWLYAVDAKSGEMRYSVENRRKYKETDDEAGGLRAHVVSAPIVLDGALLFVSDDGSAYAVR